MTIGVLMQSIHVHTTIYEKSSRTEELLTLHICTTPYDVRRKA